MPRAEDASAARLAALGVPRERIEHVARGVDLELFHPRRRDRRVFARYGIDIDADAPIALYVGRLSKEKNLAGLLAAWKLVRARHPRATLAVVGDRPIASSVGGDGVVGLGVQFREPLAELFASADVFALASKPETFGNVVVEAAASGLPAVVARGGVRTSTSWMARPASFAPAPAPTAARRASLPMRSARGAPTRLGARG